MQTASEESVRVYRASDQPIEAELLDGDARTPSTFARLADVLLAWRDDRSCFGAAVFDFEPCGAAAQTLRMPKPYELLQLSVDGLPVEPEAVGDGAWRFTLASARRPQRIEAIFRGGVSEVDHGGRLEFSAPRLEDCRVRHTLWTLIGPTSWIPGKTREDAPQPCSDSEAELLRMQSAAGSVESPAGEHADIGSYAGRSDDMDQTANAAPAASAWNDLACRFAGKSFSRVQYAVEGSSHSLILDYRRAVAERMFFRSTPARLAASLLGLGAALAVLLRRAYSALAFATKSAQNSRA